MTYEEAKRNGICAKCFKKPALKDRALCETCLEKARVDSRITRKNLIELGICPLCKKELIMGSERTCPECRAKMAERQSKKRKEHPDIVREQRRRSESATYTRRKEQGLCTRCGKELTDKRFFTCDKCRAYLREKDRAPIEKRERYKYNLCLFCDNELVEGHKVCQKHLDVMQTNVSKARACKISAKSEEYVMKLSKYPTSTLDKWRESLNLTEDESEIYDLLSKGKTIKEIAMQVGMSTRTVDNRIASIRSKLNQIGVTRV